jgi:Protein of unknown function (DUF3626)
VAALSCAHAGPFKLDRGQIALEDLRELARPRKEPADLPIGRVLDTQIEAQVHGPLDLQKDVELLVADPAFAPTGPEMSCAKSLRIMDSPCTGIVDFGCLWERFQTIFVDRRCPASRAIAGENGIIDAAVIGTTEASSYRRPDAWRDWGSRAEVLQHLQQLWHVLVHYGAPAVQTS